jgi:L-ascorbate metabolism protein UlaG (beta-lactamase superfamily)
VPGVSDHFDGQRFFNPTRANGRPVTEVPRMMAERRTPWPAHLPVALRVPPPLDGASAVITFIGHSTFLIQTAAGNILTDPMFSERASPVQFAGPRRARAPAVRFEDLPAIHVVLLSHNHYDHCDRGTLAAIARRWQAVVVTPIGNRAIVASTGVRRIVELDWWEETTEAPMPIAVGPAQHFSARTPFDRNRALWGSFAIRAAGRLIFFAGDSGYGPHFAAVRARLGPPDLALLPIGAYEPRWFMKDIHMNPEEAVQAHLALGAARSIGMHFGTFQLTLEGIDDPVSELDAARRRLDVDRERFDTLDFGASFRLD